MKHEAVFKKIRKLIDERELDEAHLDTAFDLLEELIEKDPACDRAYGLISEIYYWTGEYADPEDKLFNFEHGVDWGEKGVAVNENSLESNFWLAVNYGSYGTEKGIMKSLALIQPIKNCVERVLKIDEGYFYGGPWRVLGRLYHKAPGFPFSIGDSKKSLECFENALRLGPKFYLNHLFIAELYQSLGNKAKTREHLEWIINAPLNKNHEKEDQGYKRDAAALLEKIL
jgi:tetratricopeptide (TPR) repeat protein